MKKIIKAIRALYQIIKSPSLLNLVLDENSVRQKKVSEKYNFSKGLPVVQLDDLFPDFSEKLMSFSFLGGGSLPTDVALLKAACRKFENPTYFEIGTWRGESVRNVADVAKECWTLNLSKEQMLALGLSEKYADAHAYFSKSLKNVQHLNGDSRTFDYAGLNKKFDVIFIDGNHHYDFVKSDTENAFRHLAHENSIVIWHDYAYDPENVRFEILEAILDGIPKEFQPHLYHVANTMCAIFIRGDFPVNFLEKYGNPTATFEVTIKTKLIL